MITLGDTQTEFRRTILYKGPVVPEVLVDMWVFEDICKCIRTRDITVTKLIKMEKNGEDVEDEPHYCFNSPWSEDYEHKHIRVNAIFHNNDRTGYPMFMLKLGLNELPSKVGCLRSFVIGFNRAYIETIGEDDKRYPKYKMELRLYEKDKLVAIVRCERAVKCKNGWNDLEFVHGTYMLDNGGCLYCDNAVYRKDAETGLIYIKCTKYDGEVLETEYDGTKYPKYCKRRV